NGAPARTPGKQEIGKRWLLVTVGFNGAPARTPGKLLMRRPLALPLGKLQWSPGADAGETPRSSTPSTAKLRTSMEHRRGRRGNARREYQPGPEGRASMEPRRGRRGNSPHSN